MNPKSVRDLDVRGKRVLIRADLNVPMDAQRRITDPRRVEQFLPTLQHVISNAGKAIVMSHLGRPKGDPTSDAQFSLKPVAELITKLIGKPVRFADDCVGPPAESAVRELNDGDVLLLENLRFHKAETIIDKAAKNPDGKLTAEQDAARAQFARQLASLGQAYVNDAFGTCHRNHVSMYDVPRLMPAGTRAMGFLVEKELRYLGQAVTNPARPFVAILGGAKVSDKIELIRNLLSKVDKILIGGAMTFTFWAAQGKSIGKSLCERDKIELAAGLLRDGAEKIVLPSDSVAATELKAGVATRVVTGDLPNDLMGLDIGPRTLESFSREVRNAKTIVWNGPLGAFETRPFEAGTMALARLIADATEKGAISIIGGGDSAAAVEQAGLADKMTHVSTGGGASLTFLEGKKFETLEVLDPAPAMAPQ